MEELEGILSGKVCYQSSHRKAVPTGSILRQIRLFICSTYHDFIKERELLWLRVLPELQQHCTQYGVDILFFDPYRQSNGDFVHDPVLCEEIKQHLKKLKQESGGPYFLCLLGDKYGPCPIPVSLKGEEFQHIKQSLFEGGGDVKVLDDFYRLNGNDGSQYDLQPKAKEIDSETYQQLQEAIQKGAKLAHADGLINQVNPKLQNRFYASFVEQCAEVALEGSKHRHSNCLFVLRKFDDSEEMLSEMLVEKEQSASQQLADLKNNITQTYGDLKDNLLAFHTHITPGKEKEFASYLEHFEHQVTRHVKKLIDNIYQSASTQCGCGSRSLPQSAISLLDSDDNLRWTFDDAVNHYSEFLIRKTKNFVGHTENINIIREFCVNKNKDQNDKNQQQQQNGIGGSASSSKTLKKFKPIFISGEDGSGRTSFLCELGRQCQEWFNGEVIMIVRFVSQVGFSKFASEMLRSLCLQMSYMNGLQSLLDQYCNEYSIEKLSEWLLKCCMETVSKSQKPLIIMVDDLDLLKYGHYLGGRDSYKQSCFPWIPLDLPDNVYFFATISIRTLKSALPLKKVQGRQKTDANVIQISRLSEDELLEMVKNLLNDHYNRSVTLDQQAFLRDNLKQCPNPFYANLLAHEAAKWPSWLDVCNNGRTLPGHALAFLEKKFNDIESVYGQDICSAVFSFLECANQGLTDTELLDLCSYHSALTRKCMTIQTPDAENLYRITYITWLQIKNDMRGVIIERRLDNKLVATWSCPLIRYVVRGKFLASNQLLKQCHSDMADLFDDAWTYNQPPKRFRFVSRLPTPQPLYSIQQSNGITHYNKRRVNNLWYHLLHSGSIDYFEEQSLLNYEYLEAILYSSGLVKLLSIIEDASLQIVNHNLYILYSHCVKPAMFSISLSPNLFVTELIGRLRYTRIKNTDALNHLVDQAMQWIDTNCVSPSLVPLTCWIKPPSTHLVVSLTPNDWPKESKSLVKPTVNYQYVFVCGSHSPDIYMFHVASNTLVRIFKGHTGVITVLECSSNGQFFLSSSMPENSVRVWSIMKGECIRTISAHNAKIICLRISRDDRCLISGSADSTVKVIDIETGRVIRTLSPESGAVTALVLTTHEEYLVTGHSDFTVKLWHMDTGRMISKLGNLMAPVTLMALTSNDAFLLVASDDETLHVYSLCSGTELHELRGHEGKVASLAIASDDCQTFIGSTDGKIYRYDLHTGKILSIQGCSNLPVTALQMSSDGHFLFSICAGVVQLWNVEKHMDYRKVNDHSRFVTAIAMSNDGKYAATGTAAGLVCLWDLEMCYVLWCAQNEMLARFTCLLIDTESMILFSGTKDGYIFVWSMADGSLIRRYSCHKTAIRSMFVMPDKRRIITHDIDGVLKVGLIKVTTNLKGRRQLVVGGTSGGGAPSTSGIEEEESDEEDDNELEVEGVTLPGVADWSYVDPNDEILVRLVDSNKELNKWEFASENETIIKSKILHSEPITCICRSRDYRYIITGSTDMSMKIWEVASSSLTQALVGHAAHIIKCDVDEKFRIIVSAAADNVAMTWDVQTGNNLAKFSGLTKSVVTALKVSNDGYLAFTGYKDGWLHAWFSQTGQRLASFNAYLCINELLLTTECHRIILLLDQCQHFSVLCFHNCPVIRSGVEQVDFDHKSQDYDRDRRISHAPDAHGGSHDHKSKQGDIVLDASQNTAEKFNTDFKKSRKNSKVFAPIERTRSKASIFDSPSTKFTAEKPSGQITVDKKTSNKESDSKENTNEKQSRSKFCCLL